jgi:hypothetical protein
MKIRSLVGLAIIFVFTFFSVSDAFAYSRSSSRSSYSSHRSSSYSSHKATSSYSKPKSYSTPRKSYSTPKKPSINLKKTSPAASTKTKPSVRLGKTATTKKTVSLKKPSYVKKSTTVNVHINTRPKSRTTYYHGHHTYYYGGHTVYFMGNDFEDCDYDDYLEGDMDCQAYYPDNDNVQVAAAPVQKVATVKQGPSAGLIVFRWVMGFIFFAVLIGALLLLAKRMRKF